MLWKVGEICEKKEQSRVRQGNLFYRGDLWSCWEKKFWQELVCLSLLGKYLIRAQLFKRQITQSKGWITIHWVSVKKTSCTTHRIEIYLINGFVNPSNNRGQVSLFWLSAIFNINRWTLSECRKFFENVKKSQKATTVSSMVKSLHSSKDTIDNIFRYVKLWITNCQLTAKPWSCKLGQPLRWNFAHLCRLTWSDLHFGSEKF